MPIWKHLPAIEYAFKKSGIIYSVKVRVRLYASLRKFGPEEQEIELPDNSTVEDLVKILKLPKMPLLKVVNSEVRHMEYPLKDGDEVAIFPPIAGG